MGSAEHNGEHNGQPFIVDIGGSELGKISASSLKGEAFNRVMARWKDERKVLTRTRRSIVGIVRDEPRIVPLKDEQALQEDDPIFRLDELAEPIGPLTNAEIDTLIYDQ